jgi:hypothetical protein
MASIYWNLAFTALNIYWICRLLLERRPVKLSAAEQRLCELVLRTMTPREMINAHVSDRCKELRDQSLGG